MTKKKVSKRLPDTPTQRWLRAHGACISGRRRVGARTGVHYFWRSRSVTDLFFVLEKLSFDVERLDGRPEFWEWRAGNKKTPRNLCESVRHYALNFGMRFPIELTRTK